MKKSPMCGFTSPLTCSQDLFRNWNFPAFFQKLAFVQTRPRFEIFRDISRTFSIWFSFSWEFENLGTFEDFQHESSRNYSELQLKQFLEQERRTSNTYRVNYCRDRVLSLLEHWKCRKISILEGFFWIPTLSNFWFSYILGSFSSPRLLDFVDLPLVHTPFQQIDKARFFSNKSPWIRSRMKIIWNQRFWKLLCLINWRT